MDNVEPTIRRLIGSAPPVGAAARIRRLEREQERERGKGSDDARGRDEAGDDGEDDGMLHIDVLA